MADEPQLSNGSDGEWVEYLQETLVNWGYDTGPVDRIFGPITEAANRGFRDSLGGGLSASS